MIQYIKKVTFTTNFSVFDMRELDSCDMRYCQNSQLALYDSFQAKIINLYSSQIESSVIDN